MYMLIDDMLSLSLSLFLWLRYSVLLVLTKEQGERKIGWKGEVHTTEATSVSPRNKERMSSRRVLLMYSNESVVDIVCYDEKKGMKMNSYILIVMLRCM